MRNPRLQRYVSDCVFLQSLLFAALLAGPAAAASLTGRVVDARSGEPLSKVKVIVTGTDQRTLTDASGEFALSDLPSGEVELYITTVGYGLVKRRVSGGGRLDIALHPEASVRTDSVTVTAGPFEPAATNTASERTLSKPEIQALSMVILSDPLRAAQALPGVTSNNEFRAEFAVRGAAYEHVGIWLDGVLTDGFVHSANLGVGGTTSSEKLSLSIVNGDTVSEMALYPGAYPSRFGDSTAAVLSLETRDGSFVKPAGRIATGLLVTSAAVDAPFAHRRGSWLLAGRSSYADYLQRLVERITGTGRYSRSEKDQQGSGLDFSDGQTKTSYNFSARHQAGFSLLYGRLAAHDRLVAGDTDLERINRLRSDNMLATAFWRYTPGPHTSVQSRVFGLTGSLRNQNRNAATLDDRDSQQIGGRSDVVYLAGAQTVEGGVYVRSTREDRLANSFSTLFPLRAVALETFRKRATEDSYYLQDTWKRERFSLTVGGRIMHANLPGQTVVSPRASLTWKPAAQWSVRAGAGSYAQFPTLEQMFGFFGNPRLRAEQARHFNIAVERGLGSRARIFAEWYDREDRNQIFSLWEPRLVNNLPFASAEPFGNLLRGHARGTEIGVQRRSANKLTGWVSYAYMVTQYQDARDGLTFPSDFEQRHTVNAFGSYRFRPTIDMSMQWRFGNGQRIPGFIEWQGTDLGLSALRNTAQLQNYSRLDFRANKAFLLHRWKLTLSGEVLNLLNRKNLIAISTDPVRLFSSFRYSAGLEDSFGVLPSLRVAFEF